MATVHTGVFTRSFRLIVVISTVVSVACGGRSCGTPKAGSGTTGSTVTANDPSRPLLTVGQILAPFTKARSEFIAMLQGRGRDAAIGSAALADSMDVAFDTIARVSDQLTRESWDPAAIIKTVGSDPTALLKWVSQETMLVPYRGVLRGSTGVLMDRTGNSLDRSLLLADLLKRAGQQVRLARGSLSRELAAQLRGSMPTTIKRPSSDGNTGLATELLESHVSRVGGPRESATSAAEQVRRAMDAARKEVQRRSEVESGVLMTFVGSPENGDQGTTERDLAALADHWWVQLRVADAWRDLDPQGIVVTGGDAVKVEGTFAPDQVGEDLRHRVRLRVGIECQCGGKLVERAVFEQVFNVAEGDAISLRQGPVTPPPADIFADSGSTASMLKWLTEQKQWLSVLVVGSSAVQTARITSDGQVLTGNESGRRPPAGGLLDAFGGGGDEPPASGTLSAQFIDYEVQRPGEPVQTERRYLFDWIGSDARKAGRVDSSENRTGDDKALDAIQEVEILLLGAQPSPSFVSHRFLQSVLSNRPAIMGILRNPEDQARQALNQPQSEPSAFPAELYDLALARLSFSTYRDRTFFAEPNVLTRHQGVRRTKEGTGHWSAFDIVSSAVRFTTAERDHRPLAVHQGVLDANIEVLLASVAHESTNVAELMVTRSNPDQWQVTQTDGDADHLRITPKVPASAAQGGGSWRIDRRNGNVLALSPSGWGGTQIGADYGWNTWAQATKSINFILKIAGIIMCVTALEAQQLLDNLDRRAQGKGPASPGKYLLKVAGCMVLGMLSAVGGITPGGLGQLLGGIGNTLGIGFVGAMTASAVYNRFSATNMMNQTAGKGAPGK